MKRVYYVPLAERDLSNILIDISFDRPRTARKLVERIKKRCELGRNPNLGQLRPDLPGSSCRITTVGKYVIVYHVLNDEIEILRVVHGAREWKKLV